MKAKGPKAKGMDGWEPPSFVARADDSQPGRDDRQEARLQACVPPPKEPGAGGCWKKYLHLAMGQNPAPPVNIPIPTQVD